MDPKWLVADGYDRIAETYAAFVDRCRDDPRDRYTAFLLERLPAGARVLELGCGCGVPTARQLTRRFAVTGVDLSRRQVELARVNVLDAAFIQADMTRLDLPSESYDAVVAFYSITHVPRREHRGLLEGITRWLRPGGILVASMGAESSPDCVENDWLGAPMFFSHYGARTNRRLVREAGLEVLSARIVPTDEDGVPVPFLWIVAAKPPAPTGRGLGGILA